MSAPATRASKATCQPHHRYANERAVARAAISDFGAVPVMFEDNLGAQDITAERAYLSGVASSEVYVGPWGPRYGVKMPHR